MKKELKTKDLKNEQNEQKKKVLFVASEAQPFCATGGLADVCGSLPKEIKRVSKNIEIRTIIPLYSNILMLHLCDRIEEDNDRDS